MTDEVDRYRIQVMDWLCRKSSKWARTANRSSGAAAKAASFYAAAYSNAAEGVAKHEPEKRAIMESKDK